jgi:steroid 5-alpha reductase family enzyme
MSAVLPGSAVLLAVGAVALWAWSLRLRDASIADVAWGPAFATVALGALVRSPISPRGLLLAGGALAWGLRLAVHLGRRRARLGEEDRRYRAMRAAAGPSFPRRSLLTVFLLQAALAWVVSLPLQAGIAAGGAVPLGPRDLAGLSLYAVGLAFEGIGDAQLAHFLAGPRSAGQVMDRGLWRYTRHPNYFGDALVWWGLGLLGTAAAGAWVLVGPALMTLLLLRVSGVTLLERDIGGRRPGYAAYAARTSAFLPWPPRR